MPNATAKHVSAEMQFLMVMEGASFQPIHLQDHYGFTMLPFLPSL